MTIIWLIALSAFMGWMVSWVAAFIPGLTLSGYYLMEWQPKTNTTSTGSKGK